MIRNLMATTLVVVAGFSMQSASANILTFDSIASANSGSPFLLPGPYQAGSLEFYDPSGQRLAAGVSPFFPVGPTGPTLMNLNGGGGNFLLITAAGGSPYPSTPGNTPFNLTSFDISGGYAFYQLGGAFRINYFDATGFHAGVPINLDGSSGLQTISLDLTNVLGVELYVYSMPSNAYMIDNVVYSLPAAPEPSTWAMMILGFLGLGYIARRRNNQHRRAQQAAI